MSILGIEFLVKSVGIENIFVTLICIANNRKQYPHEANNIRKRCRNKSQCCISRLAAQTIRVCCKHIHSMRYSLECATNRSICCIASWKWNIKPVNNLLNENNYFHKRFLLQPLSIDIFSTAIKMQARTFLIGDGMERVLKSLEIREFRRDHLVLLHRPQRNELF